MINIIRPTRDEYNAILRRDFATFIAKSAKTLSPAAPFRPNWHISAIAWHLEQVRVGNIKRLIINMPPRSLKSISASIAFPAYVLGLQPTRRLICVSYASDLTTKLMNDFRAVVESKWYRDLFPNMRVSGKNSESEVATDVGGGRLATSVGGTLTGRGGDIIVIDDPLKPQDAASATRRDGANAWYSSTLVSRLDDKANGAIVIVMQRLHLDDLTGFVTAGSDAWTVLNLPAIAEEETVIRIGEDRWHTRRVGNLLHGERESADVYDDMKRTLGSQLFSAQYQQAPVPEGGAMVKRQWVRRYDVPPPRTYQSRIIQSWDTASKAGPENDWSVGTTWQQEGNLFYLLDVERGRYDYPTLRSRVASYAEQWSPTLLLIEDTAAGIGLIQELPKQGLYPIAVKVDRDKIARMSIQSGKFEAGRIYLPNSAPWLADYEIELFGFPHARNDDQIDSTAQALAYDGGTYDTTMNWVAG